MTNSEFLYKGNARNLKDSVIGRFIDELAARLNDSEEGWLRFACKQWTEDWKTMPPGCKDIDLDTVIVDDEKKHTFEKKVREIQSLISEESIKGEIGRILELINCSKQST